MIRAPLALFFFIFTFSGFCGLIYESIWSQYLKLYLGHAAYAQALVLAIFMGGMSVGAWLCGTVIHRLRRPVRAYAFVEGLIGVAALLFDGVFRGTTAFVLENVLLGLDSPASANVLKWGVAAALILPQSVLLGATFPLMSNGLLRLFPATPGRTLGMLYFTNSLGGAIGILVSGFILIGRVGLPGTVLFAGICNILLAIVVYRLAKGEEEAVPAAVAEAGTAPSARAPGLLRQVVLAAALATGLSSFVYEIAWIRMLSMVLGASTHAFELMVSAFITGLAIGGFLVRKRIPGGAGSLRHAGAIQMLKGLAAFATVPLYNGAFDLMSYFMSALSRSGDGYPLFNLASHGLALAVMLPATILAGMTLPLFTAILLESGHGERSVGQVYAVNTLGAIAGTAFTLFVLMPLLGLERTMFAGAILDAAVGVAFLWLAFGATRATLARPAAWGGVALAWLVLISVLSSPDPRRMASGVFRTGDATVGPSARVVAHYDGATASVSVLKYRDGTVSILTNGKPDASARPDPDEFRLDEPTMVLAAALPLSIKPDARDAAVIGFGSGMSTHTLLTVPGIRRVDTVEIERAMYEGARHFGIRSELAFTDPRSRVFFEDAKTFFYGRGDRYDIIVSEPSNPWVSGIASLFTDEFYRIVRRFLKEDGILVQWVHAYETDELLISSILKALTRNFPDYQVYATNHTDLVVIAGMRPGLPPPSDAVFREPRLRQELARLDVHGVADLRVRFLADRAMLEPFLARSPAPVNSDYFPFVDQRAARALFARDEFEGLHEIRRHPVPLALAFRPEMLPAGGASRTQAWGGAALSADAAQLATPGAVEGRISDRVTALLPELQLLRDRAAECPAEGSMPAAWEYAFLEVMIATVAYLDGQGLARLLDSIEPRCQEALTPVQAALVGLFRSYAERDFATMADASAALLIDRTRYNPRQREFLFSTRLLALTALGDFPAGLATWGHFIEEHYLFDPKVPFSMRLLYARLLAMAEGAEDGARKN